VDARGRLAHGGTEGEQGEVCCGEGDWWGGVLWGGGLVGGAVTVARWDVACGVSCETFFGRVWWWWAFFFCFGGGFGDGLLWHPIWTSLGGIW